MTAFFPLPSGVLANMRTTAAQFMQEPVTLYVPEISYDTYGSQIITSGSLTLTSGYVGAVSGKDRELVAGVLRQLQDNGIQTSYLSTVLLPIDTELEDTTVLVINDQRWRVVWDNRDTMDSVQLYTKIIALRITNQDEQWLQ